MKKVMGLDVGDVRIGIAISDSILMTAQGIATLQRIGIKKDTSAIISIIDEHDCGHVVVGLPKNLDGSHSVQTDKVEAFKTKLKNKLKAMGKADIGISFIDERFTTKIAERVLIEGNVRREKRKNVIDKQAAIIILQSYLDSLPSK